MTRRVAYLLLCCAVALACGCGRGAAKPQTLAVCREAAVTARDQAKLARQGRDPKQAAVAERAAGAAGDQAQTLFKQAASPADADKRQLAETLQAAREGRRYAQLTREDQRYAAITQGLKAKAYRGLRGPAVSGTPQAAGLGRQAGTHHRSDHFNNGAGSRQLRTTGKGHLRTCGPSCHTAGWFPRLARHCRPPG